MQRQKSSLSARTHGTHCAHTYTQVRFYAVTAFLPVCDHCGLGGTAQPDGCEFMTRCCCKLRRRDAGPGGYFNRTQNPLCHLLKVV